MSLIDNKKNIETQGDTVNSTVAVNLIGGVRNDILSTLPQSEGSAVPIRVSSTGAIYVEDVGGGGGGGGDATAVNQIAIGSSIYDFQLENNNNLIDIGSSIYDFQLENNNNLIDIGSSIYDFQLENNNNLIDIGSSIYDFQLENNNNLIDIGSSIYDFQLENNNNLIASGVSLFAINTNLDEGNVFLEIIKDETNNQGLTLDTMLFSLTALELDIENMDTNLTTQTTDIDLIKGYTEYPVRVRAGMCLIDRGGVVNIGGYFNTFQSGEETIIASFGGNWDGTSIQKTASSYTIEYDQSLEGTGVSGIASIIFDYIGEDYFSGTSIHVLGNTGSDITPFTGFGINSVKIKTTNGYGYKNLADISIYDNGMSSYQALIPTGKGGTNQLIYHVPWYAKLLIENMTFNSIKLIGDSPKIKINGYVFNRNDSTEIDIFELVMDTNISNDFNYTPEAPLVVDEKEVFYLRATSDTDNTIIRGRIGGVLLPIPIPPPDLMFTIFTGTEGTYILDRIGELTQSDVNTVEGILTAITQVEIGTAITGLGIQCFMDNLDLITVIFRDSENSNCSSLAKEVFRTCSNLITCDLPPSITSIGSRSYLSDVSLESIDPLPINCSTVELNAYYYCANISSVRIRSALTSIDDSVFRYCANLTSVIFDSSLQITSLTNDLFRNCGIISIIIPIQIKNVNNAFQDNPLTRVQLGVGLVTIGANCFDSTIITQVLWDAGNARTVDIGTNCFGSTGMTAYNGTTYDVPLGGATFS
jgi:hypothetical protein